MNATLLQPLPPEDANVVIVHMLTTSRAVDLYLGDLTRRSRSESGRTADSYRRVLYKFIDGLRPDEDVTALTPDDCRRFLDRYNKRKPGTQATNYAILNSFLEWLYRQQRIKRNPLDHVPRPRRIPAEDLDVTTVSTADVARLLAVAQGDTERLAVAIPAYMGPRRHATAMLRLTDYDQPRGRIRFREKGGKTIWKPVPAELAVMIDAAIATGAIPEPDGYLVPPEGKLTRQGDRDDRVIWRVVKRVAGRAGIEAHVHALRAAFAVFYLEQGLGPITSLQDLMGHASIRTTQDYLRRMDKEAGMESVRGLSWGGVPTGNLDDALSAQIAGLRKASSDGMGAGGFEPPSADNPHGERADSKPGGEEA